MGPFPQSKGQVKFVIVVIDYMTKWVRAKALRNLTEKDCLDFFMKEVVLRFCIPKILISNNRTQFVRQKFEERLAELYIQHRKASVKHPQANGQVEVTNRTLLAGVKKRLDETNCDGLKSCLNVLWAY